MTYTIEEIIGAWYECYGEYMEELVAQAAELIKKYASYIKREEPGKRGYI